jgi:hypothetical protein
MMPRQQEAQQRGPVQLKMALLTALVVGVCFASFFVGMQFSRGDVETPETKTDITPHCGPITQTARRQCSNNWSRDSALSLTWTSHRSAVRRSASLIQKSGCEFGQEVESVTITT